MSAEDRNRKVSSDEECTPRERSFDELTKGLASATVSRRGALRLLAGALLGGALASTGLGRIGDSNGEAQAQVGAPGGSTCSNQGESCTAQKCCRGLTCIGESGNRVCCPRSRACGSLCCATGQECLANNVCSGCPEGQQACASTTLPTGACVDVNTDVLNCGGCGNKCGQAPANAQAVCVGGECDFVCNADFTRIGESCCRTELVCGNNCLATACDPLQCQRCDEATGTCVPLPLDTVTNCGTCGNQCATGQGCCGGTCVDLNTDVLNCGACGTTCAQGQSCVDGACQVVCSPGQTLCNGQCVSLNTVTNCGSCNNACAPGQGCCGGVCTALNTASNCGACGTTCSGNNNVCCLEGTQFKCKRGSGQRCSQVGQCCSGVCLPTGVCA